MKKLIVLVSLFAFIAAASSCVSGHKSQSWHPKTGKKPKSGHNR